MIWSALHTFNTSPQIKDKELKELFPIVVISAFGFQDFLDSLANVGTPPSNLIHEIHMALLHPLLRQHINNQIAALKRKDSEATVPKWITSSCESAVRAQDMTLRLDRIRWPAVSLIERQVEHQHSNIKQLKHQTGTSTDVTAIRIR